MKKIHALILSIMQCNLRIYSRLDQVVFYEKIPNISKHGSDGAWETEEP